MRTELADLLGAMRLVELDPWIKRRAMETFPIHGKTLNSPHVGLSAPWLP